MLRIVICATFIFMATIDCRSQTVGSTHLPYKISAPYKSIDGPEKFYLSSGNKIVALKIDRRRNMYVQVFDSETGNILSDKTFDSPIPKEGVFERAALIGNEIVVLYNRYDKDKKTEQLFMVKIDVEKGVLEGESKLLLTAQGKVTGVDSHKMMDIGLTDKFPTFPAADGKNFLVKYRRKPEVSNDKKNYDVIGLAVFNGNWELVSKREITMPYTERMMDILNFNLTDNGALYILTKVFHDNSNNDIKSSKDSDANYHHELLNLKPGSSEFVSTTIDSKGRFINNIMMFAGNENNIVVGGFYSNGQGKFFERNCDGLFSINVDSEGRILNQSQHDLPLEIIDQYSSKREKRKNQKKEDSGESAKLTNLYLRDLMVDSDGGIFFGAEQYSVVSTVNMYSSGFYMAVSLLGGYRAAVKFAQNSSMGEGTLKVGLGANGQNYYNYDDIIAAKIDRDGKLKWMRKIPKNQVGTDGRGSMSYNYYNFGGNHNFVFLDNIDNLNLTTDDTPEKYKDGGQGYLTAVTIDDKTGNVSKSSILNIKEVEDFKLKKLSMDRFVKSGNNSFMMEAYKKGNEDVMITVDLK